MKDKLIVALVAAVISQPGIAWAADSMCARMQQLWDEDTRRTAAQYQYYHNMFVAGARYGTMPMMQQATAEIRALESHRAALAEQVARICMHERQGRY